MDHTSLDCMPTDTASTQAVAPPGVSDRSAADQLFFTLAEQLRETVDFAVGSVVFTPEAVLVYGRDDRPMPTPAMRPNYYPSNDTLSTVDQQWIVENTVCDMPARRAALNAARALQARMCVVFDAQDAVAFSIAHPLDVATTSGLPRPRNQNLAQLSHRFVAGTQHHAIDLRQFANLAVLHTIVSDVCQHADALPLNTRFLLSEDHYSTTRRLERSSHEQVVDRRVLSDFCARASGDYPITHVNANLWVERTESATYVTTNQGLIAVLYPTYPLGNFGQMSHNGLWTHLPHSTEGVLRFFKDMGVQECIASLDGGGDEGCVEIDSWTMQPGRLPLDLTIRLPMLTQGLFEQGTATLSVKTICCEMFAKVPEENWWDGLGACGQVVVSPFAANPDDRMVADMQENEEEDYDDEDEDEDAVPELEEPSPPPVGGATAPFFWKEGCSCLFLHSLT